jgi:transposase-like protein
MFTNLRELIASMPDEKTCRDYLAQQRWNGKPICPFCGFDRVYLIEHGKRWKCANPACYNRFSVITGTVFENSKIPVSKWLTAVYISTAHKKGISSYQLAKDIGVSQKTSWFMLHRIRESLKERHPRQFSRIVESDETYMARKYASDFVGLPPEQVTHMKANQKQKGAVLGLVERSSKQVKVQAFASNTMANIKPAVKAAIATGSTLYTDEASMYQLGLDEYTRGVVQHSKREWAKGPVHTNNVENFWSVMKRGVYGIYHQISYKHLQRYCDEFAYRYNSRKMKDSDRFVQSIRNCQGRLTYKQLVQKSLPSNNGEGIQKTQESQ